MRRQTSRHWVPLLAAACLAVILIAAFESWQASEASSVKAELAVYEAELDSLAPHFDLLQDFKERSAALERQIELVARIDAVPCRLGRCLLPELITLVERLDPAREAGTRQPHISVLLVARDEVVLHVSAVSRNAVEAIAEALQELEVTVGDVTQHDTEARTGDRFDQAWLLTAPLSVDIALAENATEIGARNTPRPMGLSREDGSP